MIETCLYIGTMPWHGPFFCLCLGLLIGLSLVAEV